MVKDWLPCVIVTKTIGRPVVTTVNCGPTEPAAPQVHQVVVYVPLVLSTILVSLAITVVADEVNPSKPVISPCKVGIAVLMT